MFGRVAVMAVASILISCGEEGDGERDVDEDLEAAAMPAPQVIRIGRAARVGDRYHFEGEGRSRQAVEVMSEGKSSQEGSRSEEFTVHLVADVEVLAVDEHKRASKVIILVNSLTRADAGGTPSTLLENTVVDAESDKGGVVYSVAGLALEEKAQQALTLFTLMNGSGRRADEDAIFGTGERHMPGAEWPVNKAAIADFFEADTGMELVPDSIQGTMKFEKTEIVDGVECQLLSGQVRMDMIRFPGVPREATLTRPTVEFSLSGAFPVDQSLPTAEKRVSMKMAPILEYTTNGITVEMKMTIERDVSSRTTPRR